MLTIRKCIKKALLPVTILLVPHNNAKRFSINLPLLGIILPCLFLVLGSGYLISLHFRQAEMVRMESRLHYYQKQFEELGGAIQAIKKAENEFNQVFSLKTEGKGLDRSVSRESGYVDIDALRDQIQPTVETVKKIRQYMEQQRVRYWSIPRGLPVKGRVTSAFGWRENPFSGVREFHPALDIQAEPASPVKSTADGVISFAGWNKGSGNLVAIEHGFGFSTYYGHNKTLAVKAGQRVKRGEVIAWVGSTGNATGPHSHYEIREKGIPLDPNQFLEKGR